MIANKIETQSIQLWPSGKSVRYAGYYPEFHDENGVVFPEDLQREIQIELRAEAYSRNEVLCVDSCLVDELIEMGFKGFMYGEDINLNVDPSDWDFDQLMEYAEENDIDVGCATLQEVLDGLPTAEQIKGRLENEEPGYSYFTVATNVDCPGDWVLETDSTTEMFTKVSVFDLDNIDFDDIAETLASNAEIDHGDSVINEYTDELRDLIRDEEPKEIYEWWRVSRWLCSNLQSIGEVVIDNDYGCWWGRGCTGQAYIMDGTLQKIAAKFL